MTLAAILAAVQKVPKGYLYAGLVGAGIAGYAGWLHEHDLRQQQAGAAAALTHSLDSLTKATTRQTESLAVVALRATQKADSVAAQYRASLVPVRAAAVSVDTALSTLAASRDSALAIARDSAATTGQLRQEIGRLVTVSDSATAAFGAYRLAADSALAKATAAVQAGEAAAAHNRELLAAMTLRAQTAEREVALLKGKPPPKFGWLIPKCGVGATAGIGAKTHQLDAAAGFTCGWTL